eukprot:scaffold43485_cov37-Prasinocladus_malaysianus.AAC.1
MSVPLSALNTAFISRSHQNGSDHSAWLAIDASPSPKTALRGMITHSFLGSILCIYPYEKVA